MKNRIEDIIKAEALSIQLIPVDQDYEGVIELIYERVHKRGGRVIASGMGKAGQVANNIATTFSSTGTPSVFMHPSEAQHGDLGMLCENDVLIVLSNSGKTREIEELIFLTQQLHPGIPFILITGNPEGDLCQKATFSIFTGNPKEVCPLGLTPTTSTTTMMVIGDALTVLMMERIGFSASDYAKRHHGGYLGTKSRNLGS